MHLQSTVASPNPFLRRAVEKAGTEECQVIPLPVFPRTTPPRLPAHDTLLPQEPSLPTLSPTPPCLEPSYVPLPPEPPVMPVQRPEETLFEGMAKEGMLGRLGAMLAKKAKLCATRPGYVEPFHTDTLREMRKDGNRTFRLRPILAWDEHETSEPPRALKNDWKALWMGEIKGTIADALSPEAQEAFPQATAQDGDIIALAQGAQGDINGVVVLRLQNGIWRDCSWHTTGEQADRVLLATVLRFARDGKHSIALANAPIASSLDRGAFWAWEWAIAPTSGGIWGRLAGLVLAWRAKALSSKMRKNTASANPTYA